MLNHHRESKRPRRNCSLILVTAIALIWPGSSSSQEEKTPSVDEFLHGAMATRRAIQSADVGVALSVDIRDSKPVPKQSPAPTRWVVSGNKVFNRVMVPGPGGQLLPEIECRNCQASQSMTRWGPRKGPDGNWTGLAVARVGGEYKPTIFDPRVLGVNCSAIGALHAETIEGFRENLMKNVVRSTVVAQPNGLFRISIHYSDNHDRHVVMSGPPAFRVSSYEVVYSSAPGAPPSRYAARVDFESVEVPPPVYWFPRRQEYRQEADANVAHHEVCDITVHSVNRPIPNSTFEIPSFGLPPGVHVIGLPNSGTKVWDGTALIDLSLYSPPVPPPAVESVVAEKARRSRWWTWIAYALLAIGAVAFVRFLMLRRRDREAQP